MVSNLPARHRDLMTKSEQPGGPGGVSSRQPRQPPDRLNQAQIQQPERHVLILPVPEEPAAHRQYDGFSHGTGADDLSTSDLPVRGAKKSPLTAGTPRHTLAVVRIKLCDDQGDTVIRRQARSATTNQPWPLFSVPACGRIVDLEEAKRHPHRGRWRM